MNFEAVLTAFGLSKVTVVTGAMGAALAATQGEDRTRFQRTVNFFGGFCCGGFGTAAVVYYFKIEADAVGIFGALGFALGYFGMTLMDVIQQAIQSLRCVSWNEIIKSWLKRRD